MNQVNVCVLGSSGVGKTSFIRKVNHQPFEPKYIPTLAPINTIIEYDDEITFNFTDIPGQQVFNFINEYDIAIIMFDVSHYISYKNINFWISKFLTKNEGKKYIICGNKIDIDPQYHKITEGQYIEISSKVGESYSYILNELKTKINE